MQFSIVMWHFRVHQLQLVIRALQISAKGQKQVIKIWKRPLRGGDWPHPQTRHDNTLGWEPKPILSMRINQAKATQYQVKQSNPFRPIGLMTSLSWYPHEATPP